VVDSVLNVLGRVNERLYSPLAERHDEFLRHLVRLVLVDEDHLVERQTQFVGNRQIEVRLVAVRLQRTLDILPEPVHVGHGLAVRRLVRVLLDEFRLFHAERTQADGLDLDERLQIRHCPVSVSSHPPDDFSV
jgi:hypothetical protein